MHDFDFYAGSRALEEASTSFAGADDFLRALLTPSDRRSSGYSDALRAVKAATGLGEFFDAEGAGLVPLHVADEVWRMMLDLRSLPLAWVVKQGCRSNGYSMPATQDGSMTLGLHGIKTQILDEGQQATPVVIPSRKVTRKLAKRVLFVQASGELLEDSPLPDRVAPLVAEAFALDISTDVLGGNGVGRPLGIAKAKSCYQLAARGGQATGVVDAANILAMWSSLDPDSWNRSVWFAAPKVVSGWYDPSSYAASSDLLRLLRFAEPGEAENGPNATLMGRPLLASKAMAQAGLTLLLCDPTHYQLVVRATGEAQSNLAPLGASFAASMHCYFDTHRGALRWIIRNDGASLVPGPITQSDGTTTYSAVSFTPN